jgi:mono/diheme cytochrome c family protein
MRSPRYSTVLLAFALTTISVTFRALPTVEASTATPLASTPSRYFSLLSVPATLNAELQAAAKDDKPAGAQAEVQLPDGKGKDVTQRVCSTCHGVNLFAEQRHTKEKWSSIIDTMASRGMDASDEDLATINDYLATNLAPKKDAPASPPDPSSSH